MRIFYLLLAIGAAPVAASAADPIDPLPFAGRVPDRELAQITGGASVAGSEAIRASVPVAGDFAVRSQLSQQFDNWWSDVGSALIAANLLR